MSRYVDYKKRCRRTPWGFYLLAAVVVWACIMAGVLISARINADAQDTPAPVDPPAPVQPTCMVETEPAPVESESAEPTPVEPEPEPEIAEPVVVEPTEPEDCHEQELELLALVIYQEAGGDACSDETRQMVGEVALNRVASSIYPDTLAEVLLQPYQYGRLHWTGLVWPARADLPQEAHAVERAFDIAAALLTGSVERLLPEDAIFQAEFPQGTETLVEQDGFYFCR